jgi:hypothetical protein
MKPAPSNPLRRQLARPQDAGPHPDANLLTAFAEDALLPRERAQILDHLAACPSCREILRTASAAEPLPVSPAPEFARPRLRIWLTGFALAACLIVLVSSVVLFEHALRTGVARNQVSLNHPAPAATASPPTTAAPRPAATAGPAPQRPHATQAKHAAASPQRPAAPPAPIPPEPEESGFESAPQEARAAPATAPPSVVVSGSASANGNLSAAQNTFVPSEAPTTAARPSPTTAARTPAFAESRSRSFAKAAAPQHAVGGLRAGAAERWRLSDAGQVEQLSPSGAWQPVVVALNVKFRVLLVSRWELWAGGEHLALFHSTDNGVTWSQVHLPPTADPARAITDIRFDSSQKITVESDGGSTWTTSDAGQTWQ